MKKTNKANITQYTILGKIILISLPFALMSCGNQQAEKSEMMKEKPVTLMNVDPGTFSCRSGTKGYVR